MANWKPIVGIPFGTEEFDSYCKSISWPDWRPQFVTIHNTGIPNLAQRPNGFTKQHILNLQSYYQNLGWRAGPHLFVDDLQIWVFTPLNTTGRHSPSWNAIALGVEMLGDYQVDSFGSGRGLAVRQNTVSAVASLHRRLGLDPTTIRFHKEDAATTHKTCPGKNVKKSTFIAEVQARIASYYAAEHDPNEAHPD